MFLYCVDKKVIMQCITLVIYALHVALNKVWVKI